jgi:hypothetical protein
MSRPALLLSGMLLFSLAVPAAARAVPTIDPLKPCYVTADTVDGPQSEGVQITAAGFDPNSRVNLMIDGVMKGAELQTDAAGRLALAADTVPAPFVSAGSKPFTVSLTQADNPANTVAATAMSAALGVSVEPEVAKPSDRIRFKGLGFTVDRPVWAHYRHKGRLRKTVRMERRPGECGSFEARRRQIPIRRPGLGRWTVQFDQSKRYRDPRVRKFVYVRLAINLRLVPRRR